MMIELLCIAGTLIFGFLAYRLRRRSRFWFGIGEIAVGFVQVHLAWVPTYNFLTADGAANPLGEFLYKATPVILAIYLLVRGLDNIGEDLPAGWRASWTRLFGPPASPRPNKA